MNYYFYSRGLSLGNPYVKFCDMGAIIRKQNLEC